MKACPLGIMVVNHYHITTLGEAQCGERVGWWADGREVERPPTDGHRGQLRLQTLELTEPTREPEMETQGGEGMGQDRGSWTSTEKRKGVWRHQGEAQSRHPQVMSPQSSLPVALQGLLLPCLLVSSIS